MGTMSADEPMKSPKIMRRTLAAADYEAGVRAGDIGILSRAITLIESQRAEHRVMAQELLRRLLPYCGQSRRIGISGVPGAGKSTLIEALGCLLGDRGHKVAVLAVDPSSSVSGGSILGDKTRMTRLAGHPNAFIRPSPSAGSLGGVARKSRESILLCEAAGYDVILVETVGTGQNEITVRSMVDCFLLLLISGAGDDLQGMKKGIMEIADLIAVNKADGDNVARAKLACAETRRAVHLIQPATRGWETRCLTCSSLSPDSLAELWNHVEEFFQSVSGTGMLHSRRKSQEVEWMNGMIEDELKRRFHSHPRVSQILPELQERVENHALPAASAVDQVMAAFLAGNNGENCWNPHPQE